MKATLKVIILTLAFSASSLAFAGKEVRATGATPEEALEATIKAVETEAAEAHRCVSSYPNLKECVQLPDQKWECKAVRANHKGSCKKK